MGTQGAGRKRSSKKDKSTAEDDALNLIAREAEARLAAKRAARAEAREIRMKELERQQKEVEDRDYLEKGSRAASALTATTLTSLGGTSSRRGSGETSLTVDAETSIREIKEIHELKDQIQDVEIKYTQNLKEAKDTLSEVEEKYRKAMVSNAQLDNEKNNLMYQVDTLKDSLMELEELLSESNRGYEEKVKDFEREKHAHGVLQFQFSEMKETLKQSEELLNEIRQLRLKQDGFVREISDLQETVEWKDKKIGALERQKEYTDAIRTERDELREEAVKLKDILKKHGIVLGPDLSVNGDIGEAEVDGSSSGDTAHQPAPDSQTSEGNSMLGNTEETEELDPDQQPDILKEEAKENQLSSDKLCDAAVSTMETSAAAEEHPADEQQTVDESIGGSDLSKDLNVDIPDHPVTEATNIIVTSAEGNSPDTETTTGEAGLVETETQSKRDDFKQTSDKLSENKQEAAVESDLKSKETCPQQTDVKDISRDVENDEAEEVTSKSQGAAASGKRKKKKRKGKKKGNQQKDETEKENGKTEPSVEPDKKENRSTTEPDKDDSEILKESKIDQVEKEEVGKQTEEVEAAKSVEPTESVSLKEAFTEQREDHVTNKQDKEQTETIQEITGAAQSKTLSCSETPEETRVAPVTNEQNKDWSETAEIIQVVAPTETFSQSEAPKELCREAREDEPSEEDPEKAGRVEPCPPETQLSACDLTDASNSTDGSDGLNRKFTDDESELSANGPILHRESKIIDNAEDEEVDEMKPECKTEGNTEDEPHVPSSIDVAADVSESTNIHEGIDLTSASSPDSDDVTIRLKSSSDSKPQPEPSSLREESPIEVPGEDPEETTETLKDVEEAGTETEQEGFPLGVTDPERKPDEPDKKDNGSTTEPDLDDSEILKESKIDQVEKEQVGQQTEEVEAAKSVEPTETASLKEAFTEPREDHVTNQQDKEQTETIQETQDEEEAGTETEQEGFPLSVTAPELKPDEIEEEEEELDRDVNEPGGFIEPESSSRDEKSLLETEAQVEHLDDQTLECVELKDESDAKETDEINTIENLNTPESQKESSCSLAELLPESSKDKSEDDSSPPNQQGSDEEDGEEEEGQSFDFDDIDVQAAFETNQIEDEEIEEGVEAVSDPSENTESESTERRDEASGFDGCDQVESETTRQATALEARPGTEEGESSAGVAEDVNQATSSPVEEGLVQPELQGDRPVHVARDKEPPHSGKGERKNSKKGKGKGKEDCKMS
ncbi:leucine-rich repeat flightless-interacting protein 1 isoform X2 [Limanda limanda]|uniref:leucine-rich repeat flightless-interacting protein 1 isoform X2 n=1 Tax=Limanda limanda TaxID=27771 RepID=UPI0029C7B4B7|nr:leucine-rich repeat flightless-interacting protein 1 isoform X2 [Limanda limanda]